MRTSFRKAFQKNNYIQNNNLEKNRNALMDISSIQNDATQCLKLFSDQFDDRNYNKNTIIIKQVEGVSPWTNQNKQQTSMQKQTIFKKSKTSSILPYCIKKPKKGITENLKNRRYKNSFSSNQKCKTTITRYPSDQHSFSKILILDQKQNQPLSQKNQIIKSKVNEDKTKKVKRKYQQKYKQKQNQFKNMVQITSECARLKQKILQNLQKQSILTKCQQKALPLPNSIKPLSRFMKRKKHSKQLYQKSKQHLKSAFVKYQCQNSQFIPFQSSSIFLLDKAKIAKNIINMTRVN